MPPERCRFAPPSSRGSGASARPPAACLLAEQPFGELEIAPRSRKLAALGAQQAAVAQQPRLPQVVTIATEGTARAPVAGHCLVGAIEAVQDERALHLQARRRYAAQRSTCPVEFAQRARGVTAVRQRERERHTCLGAAHRQRPAVCEAYGAAEQRGGVANVASLDRNEPERALRDDRGVGITRGARLA